MLLRGGVVLDDLFWRRHCIGSTRGNDALTTVQRVNGRAQATDEKQSYSLEASGVVVSS